MTTHCMDMCLNRYQQQSTLASINLHEQHPGNSIPMRQLRPTRPDPSSPGMFTPVPRRIIHHNCTPSDGICYRHCLGPCTENCNKVEQVRPATCAARFACHRYERTASVTAMLNNSMWETLETAGVITRGEPCSFVCNTTCLFLKLIILPQFSCHEVDQPRPVHFTGRCINIQVPYARTDVYKILFLHGNCSYVECTTSIGDSLCDTLLLKSNTSQHINDYYGVYGH